MKRKKTDDPERLVPSELLEKAKSSLETDKLNRRTKCTVCGGECAPISSEPLCWVCRRLKISAWRDAENQMSVQE
jgi:hypothetical protein